MERIHTQQDQASVMMGTMIPGMGVIPTATLRVDTPVWTMLLLSQPVLKCVEMESELLLGVVMMGILSALMDAVVLVWLSWDSSAMEAAKTGLMTVKRSVEMD